MIRYVALEQWTLVHTCVQIFRIPDVWMYCRHVKNYDTVAPTPPSVCVYVKPPRPTLGRIVDRLERTMCFGSLRHVNLFTGGTGARAYWGSLCRVPGCSSALLEKLHCTTLYNWSTSKWYDIHKAAGLLSRQSHSSLALCGRWVPLSGRGYYLQSDCRSELKT